jgi:hypothetical protein
MAAGCRSRFVSRTEYGDPYWPTCDLLAGHEGRHKHGHYQDVVWSWTDAQAMTAEQLAEWGAR